MVRAHKEQKSDIIRSRHSPPSKVDTAIRAYREDKSDIIQNLQGMWTVKEGLNDYYCGISRNLGDILYVGELNMLYQPPPLQMMVFKAMWGESDSFVPRVQLFESLEGPQPNKSKSRHPRCFWTHGGEKGFDHLLHSYSPANTRAI